LFTFIEICHGENLKGGVITISNSPSRLRGGVLDTGEVRVLSAAEVESEHELIASSASPPLRDEPGVVAAPVEDVAADVEASVGDEAEEDWSPELSLLESTNPLL
jgi:hypothetical protein